MELKITDILNEKQIEECVRIVRLSNRPAQRLREYLNTMRDNIEKKEVDPDYLAYVIEYRLLSRR